MMRCVDFRSGMIKIEIDTFDEGLVTLQAHMERLILKFVNRIWMESWIK